MLRLLIVTTLLVAVQTENLNEVSGIWVPVVTYPKNPQDKKCETYNITQNENLKCKCGDAAVPAIEIKNIERNESVVVPALSIDDPKEVTTKLNMKCSCNDDFPTQFLYRKINSNYLVMYANKPRGGGYFAVVLVKKMPKLSELKTVLNSISDLRSQEPSYFCEDSAFLPE